MKINIPEDIVRELEKIRAKKHISIKKQVTEALMQYLIIEKETQRVLEYGVLI